MATTTTKNDTTTTGTTAGIGANGFELPTIEGASQQLRELNERMIATSKTAALTALDTFEKALQGVGDLEQKAAAATHQDWISAAATSHATFMTEVSAPYTKAVRDLLQ